MTLRESLSYLPVELTFGTSGLRGLVRDITHLEAYLNARAFLRYAIETGRVRPGDAVALAGDLRPSTLERVAAEGGRGEILQAVARATEDSGLRTAYLGRIPTPALMHFALSRRLASVMITGSHIPFDRNGIKFNLPTGEVLKSDEAAILEAVRRVRAEEYGRAAADSPFDAQGMLKPGSVRALPAPDPVGEEEYTARYLRAFPRGVLAGRRILVYEHSAVGRDLLVKVLRELGAEVIPAGRSEQFIPIDTEAVSDRMLADIQALVEGNGGAAIDAVVSTDGDSDRPLVLGVDDGRVRFFGGDLLGLVVADFVGARQVAVPISANDAVDRFGAARGMTVTKTRIGSPYVVAAMREVGWEANGGFLTAAPLRVPGGGELSALPTRDALLPVLAALYSSLGQGMTVSERFARLPARFGRSDLIRPFSRETSLRIIARFTPSETTIQEVRFGKGEVKVRAWDGVETTHPMADPKVAELEARRDDLEAFFTAKDGFESVEWMNFIDGVRVGFSNGDVAHLRPSGNAPELRMYACADTQVRADAIARLGVAEDGILRRITAALT